MKNLFTYLNSYITDQQLIEELNEIDATIITETLECSVLKDVAKQLKDQKNDEKKSISWTNSRNFKQIFAANGDHRKLEWDKITNKDVTKIEASEDLSSSTKKDIKAVLKDNKEAIILIKDPKTDKFEYVVFSWGRIIYLTNDGYRSAGNNVGYNTGRTWRDLSLGQKVELCKGKELYFIDCTGKYDALRNKQLERSKEKEGMVLLDEYSLKRMAQQNRERYEEIIRKNKAKRVNNDELIDKAKSIIDKASELSVLVAKDPVKYADQWYDITRLMNNIYQEKQYHKPDRAYKEGYYVGVNGILPCLMKYSKGLKETMTSSYSFYEDEYKEAKKDLEEAITKAEEMLTKLNIAI